MTTRNRKPTIKPILINESWSIRFKYRGKQYQRSIGKPYLVDKVDLIFKKTQGVANLILFDIQIDQFDETLVKYFPLPETQQPTELLPIKTNPPVIELFNKFIDYKSKLVKQSTLQNYYFVLTALERIESWVTEFDLYSANDVKDFLLGDYGKPSVIIILQKLEACLNWAIERQLVDLQVNPYRKIHKDIKVPESTANPLPEYEQWILIDKSKYPYEHLFRFLLLTGCRISEALGLQWSDIKSDHILFCRTAREMKGGVVIESDLKTQSSRKFPLTDSLRQLIDEIPIPDRHHPLIFPIRYSYVCKRFKKILPDYTIHNLRDTFITEQISKGVPTAIVARWVGNSVGMIEQRYLGLDVSVDVMPK